MPPTLPRRASSTKVSPRLVLRSSLSSRVRIPVSHRASRWEAPASAANSSRDRASAGKPRPGKPAPRR
jgi:hypothetical protein